MPPLAWPDGTTRGRSGVAFQEHLYRGVINVLEYAPGGEAELAADGTAAIQAALEAAKPVGNIGSRV